MEIRTSTTHPIDVNFVPGPWAGRLGLTFAPGKHAGTSLGDYRWERDLDADLGRLREVHRADVLVCLLADDELARWRVPGLRDAAARHGMAVRQLPIVDGGVPADAAAFASMAAGLAEQVRSGRTVVVFCRGGLGRTGTTAGCVLIELGVSPEAALAATQAARGPLCPENEHQRGFILGYRPAPPGPITTAMAWDNVATGYADELPALFGHYAEDALALAGVGPTDDILDVATGPGTLALRAAGRVASVTALDFSEEMLRVLRSRAAAAGVNVRTVHGDARSLPFPEASFDAAFSMFGLFFVPQRDRGLRDLVRVLKPGAPAVVSSWQPFDRAPLLDALLVAMRAEMPDMPPPEEVPMSQPDAVRAELEAAGLRDVVVHPVSHASTYANTAAFWDSVSRSHVMLALMRRKLGEEGFADFSRRMLDRLQATLGPGPLTAPWPAWLGYGCK